MGIKDLNTLLKRHAPSCFVTIPLSKFAGKRIAVDAHYWMYSRMCIARTKVLQKTNIAEGEPNPHEITREWVQAFIEFVLGWMSFGVTPVFVFDGTAIPEKAKTKEKRQSDRIAARAKIDSLYEQLRTQQLEHPGVIIENLRKELSNYKYISADDFEIFQLVARGIGIPVLKAKADGEHLCASLCADGKVAAVLSKDTDCLVFGCPLLITGTSKSCSYEKGVRVPHLDCVRLDKVLEGLQLTQNEFVDLCIMCGCDFNTNMSGIAAIKSYGLIKQHRSIDYLPRDLNKDCLQHVRCREIFAYTLSDNLTVAPIEGVDTVQLDPDQFEGLKIIEQPKVNPLDVNPFAIASIRQHMEMVGVAGHIHRVVQAIQNMAPASDGHITELALGPILHFIPSNAPTPSAPAPIVRMNIKPKAELAEAQTPVRLTLNVIGTKK